MYDRTARARALGARGDPTSHPMQRQHPWGWHPQALAPVHIAPPQQQPHPALMATAAELQAARAENATIKRRLRQYAATLDAVTTRAREEVGVALAARNEARESAEHHRAAAQSARVKAEANEAALTELRTRHSDSVDAAARAREQAENALHELNAERAESARLRALAAESAAKMQAAVDSHARTTAELTALRLEKNAIALARDEALDTVNSLTAELQATKRELTLVRHELDTQAPPEISQSVRDDIAEGAASAVEKRTLQLLRKLARHYAEFYLPSTSDSVKSKAETEEGEYESERTLGGMPVDESTNFGSDGEAAGNDETTRAAPVRDVDAFKDPRAFLEQHLKQVELMTQDSKPGSSPQETLQSTDSSSEEEEQDTTAHSASDAPQVDDEEHDDDSDSQSSTQQPPSLPSQTTPRSCSGSVVDTVDGAGPSLVVTNADAEPVSVSRDADTDEPVTEDLNSVQQLLDKNEQEDAEFVSQYNNTFGSRLSSNTVPDDNTPPSSDKESDKSNTVTPEEQSSELPTDETSHEIGDLPADTTASVTSSSSDDDNSPDGGNVEDTAKDPPVNTSTSTDRQVPSGTATAPAESSERSETNNEQEAAKKSEVVEEDVVAGEQTMETDETPSASRGAPADVSDEAHRTDTETTVAPEEDASTAVVSEASNVATDHGIDEDVVKPQSMTVEDVLDSKPRDDVASADEYTGSSTDAGMQESSSSATSEDEAGMESTSVGVDSRDARGELTEGTTEISSSSHSTIVSDSIDNQSNRSVDNVPLDVQSETPPSVVPQLDSEENASLDAQSEKIPRQDTCTRSVQVEHDTVPPSPNYRSAPNPPPDSPRVPSNAPTNVLAVFESFLSDVGLSSDWVRNHVLMSNSGECGPVKDSDTDTLGDEEKSPSVVAPNTDDIPLPPRAIVMDTLVAQCEVDSPMSVKELIQHNDDIAKRTTEAAANLKAAADAAVATASASRSAPRIPREETILEVDITTQDQAHLHPVAYGEYSDRDVQFASTDDYDEEDDEDVTVFSQSDFVYPDENQSVYDFPQYNAQPGPQQQHPRRVQEPTRPPWPGPNPEDFAWQPQYQLPPRHAPAPATSRVFR